MSSATMSALNKKLLGRIRAGPSVFSGSEFSIEGVGHLLYNLRWLIGTFLFLVAYIAVFIYLSTSKQYPALKDYSIAGMVIFVVGLLIGFLILLRQTSVGISGGIIPSIGDSSLWSALAHQGFFVILILTALAFTFTALYVFSGDGTLSTTLMYMLITGIFIVAGIALFYGAYSSGKESGIADRISEFYKDIQYWVLEAIRLYKEYIIPIIVDIYTTPRGILLLLGGLIVFILGWFYLPELINAILTSGGSVLQKEAISTNHPTSVGTYENLSQSSKAPPPPKKGVRRGGVETTVAPDGTFNYRYAISGWFFINQQSSSPDSGGGFKTLLNYGEKPSIQYNAATKTLRIITREGTSDTTILYESDRIPLQRWNHIVINYSNGVMDVFLNGKLVSTKRGIIPYMRNDKVIIGEQAGIEGGSANVVYYREPLSWWAIQALYNSLKSLNVPTI